MGSRGMIIGGMRSRTSSGASNYQDHQSCGARAVLECGAALSRWCAAVMVGCEK